MTKIGLRNFWFQVHKWIGLILAILIIPLCITGAALVWDEALDHGLNPQRYAVSGAQTLGPQLYVQAARAVLKPGDRIQSITMSPIAMRRAVVNSSRGSHTKQNRCRPRIERANTNLGRGRSARLIAVSATSSSASGVKAISRSWGRVVSACSAYVLESYGSS